MQQSQDLCVKSLMREREKTGELQSMLSRAMIGRRFSALSRSSSKAGLDTGILCVRKGWRGTFELGMGLSKINERKATEEKRKATY